MTWHQWNETMAKELNEAGFKARGFNSKLGKWVDNYCDYSAPSDPELFILGEVDGVKEIDYLKEIGLLNNGRCPDCGKPINGMPARFTSGSNHNMHYQICQSCCNKGKGMSVNPANNSGCMVALLFMPFAALLKLFANT